MASQLLLIWYVPKFVRYTTVAIDAEGISQRRWLRRVRLRWRDVEWLHTRSLFIRFVGKGTSIDVSLEFFTKPKVTVEVLEHWLNAHKAKPCDDAKANAEGPTSVAKRFK